MGRLHRDKCLLVAATLMILAVPACTQPLTWFDDDGASGEQGFQWAQCTGWGDFSLTTAGNNWAQVDRNDKISGASSALMAYKVGAPGPANGVRMEMSTDATSTAHDLSVGFRFINFYAMGQGGEYVKFALRDADGDFSNYVFLTPYTDDGGVPPLGVSETVWRGVTIPIADLAGPAAFDLARVNRYVFEITGDEVSDGVMRRFRVDLGYANGPLAVNWPR